MKPIIIGTLVAIAVVLTLGAWANGFKGSLATDAVEQARADAEKAGEALKPEEVKFEGGPLPAEIVAVLTDEAAGTVAVVASITNPEKKVAATNITVGIELLDASGAVVGTNTDPGTDPSLNTIAVIGPGETALYVNDTFLASGVPASATVKATGTPARQKLTEFVIEGATISEGPFGVSITGTVTNPGAEAKQGVHVMAVVREGTTVVGAGGALVSDLPGGGTADFEIFVIGQTKGELEVWAPAL